MRKNVTRAASTIDWSAPTSVAAWEYDALAYFAFGIPTATANPLDVELTTATYGGQNTIRLRGRTDTENDPVIITSAYNALDEGSIVIAPGRTYQFTGHVDLIPSPSSPDWDAESWTVELFGYPGAGQTGGATSLVAVNYPKTVDNSTHTNDDFDETFVMPAGIKSFNVSCYYTSEWWSTLPSYAFFHWRDFTLALT